MTCAYITGSITEKLTSLFSTMFTKVNIEGDEYMVANMQPNSAFSLEVICSNPKVRDITVDEVVIEAALAAAPNVEYANRTARPKLRVEQHSIILRDISPEVPVADIMKIFEDAVPTDEGAACPKATAARSDLNNTWFVSFASEEDTRKALACVRSSRFNGAPVKARLKTESLNKAYYATSDRFGPGTPGSASGDIYSPGGGLSPMMMQQNMYYGYPPGPFIPLQQGYVRMSPMGMPIGPGMWPPQMSPSAMGGGMMAVGYHYNNRQGKGVSNGNMQNNRNNRNNQQRVSPRNQQGRNAGYQQQGDLDSALGERPVGTDGGVESSVAVDTTLETDSAPRADASAGTPRYNNGQQMNRRGASGEQGRRQGDGQQTAGGQQKKKSNAGGGIAPSVQNNNPAQSKRKDNKGPGERSQGAGKVGLNKGGQQQKTAPDARRKNSGTQKGANFNLNAADFPAAWDDSNAGKNNGTQGGQKGSWTAAVLGGSKASSSKGDGGVPAATDKIGKQPAEVSDAGGAANAHEEHHSILVNSFGGEKRERHHSFSSDQHISFVADAIDEPSHLHRVPTPIPSEEEVILIGLNPFLK